MREPVLVAFAAVLGAIVGSFLNACIHRMPRGLRLDEPKRSFCPACEKTIAWYHNLPVVSWLWLRGRCASCGAQISPRYLVVELLTAGVFVWIWLAFPPVIAFVYWIFAALLITATFIDFEHYIIPDEITLGGTAVGIVAAMLAPALMESDSWWRAGLLSLAAAALGYGALWAVVESGKLAFGKKRIVLDPPEPFEFQADADIRTFQIGGEPWAWDEIFSRDSDVLAIECGDLKINDAVKPDGTIRFRYCDVTVGGASLSLDQTVRISGLASAVVIPREAMGFGDVKFIACIGAFLGWQAVVFVLMASSVIGAIAGVAMIALTKGKSGGKIPFGPYLALAALLWMAVGPELLAWYLALLRPANTL